jgi:hypothetical protein
MPTNDCAPGSVKAPANRGTRCYSAEPLSHRIPRSLQYARAAGGGLRSECQARE